jgi:hypothetical protein
MAKLLEAVRQGGAEHPFVYEELGQAPEMAFFLHDVQGQTDHEDDGADSEPEAVGEPEAMARTRREEGHRGGQAYEAGESHRPQLGATPVDGLERRCREILDPDDAGFLLEESRDAGPFHVAHGGGRRHLRKYRRAPSGP